MLLGVGFRLIVWMFVWIYLVLGWLRVAWCLFEVFI